MNISSLLLKFIFFLLISKTTFGQDVSSDSLQKAILKYSWYTPNVDSMLHKLEKNEANITFLVDNIGTYSEDEDGIILPILGYLLKHPELISIERISKEILSNHEQTDIFLLFLDYKFDDLIQYLKYLDQLLCNESISSRYEDMIKSKRREISYSYTETIDYVDYVDKSYMLFELKSMSDLKALECIIQQSFPSYYENACSVVNINKGIGDPLICVPYIRGNPIDETPYQPYIKKMYEIGYCNYNQLLLEFRK